MTADVSSWIPRKRIRIAIGIAVAFAVLAIVGSLLSPAAWVLLVPALGAGWASFVMVRIRRQLSASGSGWQQRIHELVADRLDLAPDSTASLLDIGCGDGSLLVELFERATGLEANGVDFWGDGWDYAQANCAAHLAAHGRSATLRRMDAASLDFDDASFDVVVSVMCFHEVHAPSGATAKGPLLALAEALRVLRPGGAFVLVDRFGDASEFGDGPELDEVLRHATAVERQPIRTVLDLPWPLSSKRALGPVEVVHGRR